MYPFRSYCIYACYISFHLLSHFPLFNFSADDSFWQTTYPAYHNKAWPSVPHQFSLIKTPSFLPIFPPYLSYNKLNSTIYYAANNCSLQSAVSKWTTLGRSLSYCLTLSRLPDGFRN